MNNFPVTAIREDFSILHQIVHGHPLVYFDNAATTQKPKSVIAAITEHYQFNNSNVHRAVHALSDRATVAFEQSRKTIASFINARDTAEVIFTRGTTEAINLVAHSYAMSRLKAGDEILISTMEHHANIVPWQVVSQRTGCLLRVVPLNEKGEIDRQEFSAMLSAHTKIVAFPHVSNVLGTINPVAELINEIRKKTPAVVLIDGAQAIAHQAVDVQALDCDFYVFSGHKMYAPSGIGILYGKTHLLEHMIPYQTGGEMIRLVTFAHTEYNDLPFKFEAGTPNMEGAIGMQAAIHYLNPIGFDAIQNYEQELLMHATTEINKIEGVCIFGNSAHKSGIITFDCAGAPAHDVSTLLDLAGIAVRVGHHCAMPLLATFGLSATVRASFAFYNTHAEIEHFIVTLKKVLSVLRGE
jgi:cysteine desulfurase/selenocysteine lyase